MDIKVCGMRDQHNLERLIALEPDYIGFIFYKKSKRYTERIPNVDIPSAIKKVGVFVNKNQESLLKIVTDYNLDVVQLHGDETVKYCVELGKLLRQKINHEVKIVKAFAVDDDFNFESTNLYKDACNFFLFDTKGENYGGNSIKFDWNILKQYCGTTPYFLSGGIGLDALTKLKIFLRSPIAKLCVALDVNSRFEERPGLKNIQKLKEFKEQIL